MTGNLASPWGKNIGMQSLWDGFIGFGAFVGADVAIAAGSYTGDGTTSKAITGLGFTPKFLIIVVGSADGVAATAFWTTTTLVAADAQGLANNIAAGGAAENQNLDNRILSLDSGGFTVSDDSADAHPNANTIVYHYVAIG